MSGLQIGKVQWPVKTDGWEQQPGIDAYRRLAVTPPREPAYANAYEIKHTDYDSTITFKRDEKVITVITVPYSLFDALTS